MFGSIHEKNQKTDVIIAYGVLCSQQFFLGGDRQTRDAPGVLVIRFFLYQKLAKKEAKTQI